MSDIVERLDPDILRIRVTLYYKNKATYSAIDVPVYEPEEDEGRTMEDELRSEINSAGKSLFAIALSHLIKLIQDQSDFDRVAKEERILTGAVSDYIKEKRALDKL